MRAVVQRVAKANVMVSGIVKGRIDNGLLVYLGVERDDVDADTSYMADKIRYMRIFSDATGRMNLDVSQVRGDVLLVSAFSVQADARRGRRPSFESAATPDRAAVLYQMLCDDLTGFGIRVERGSFGEDMQVHAVNDGPVCILIESRRAF